METKLSNPKYYLDENELAKVHHLLHERNYDLRTLRRRSVFVIDTWRYVATAVKERWDMEMCIVEFGHEEIKHRYDSSAFHKIVGNIAWQKINEDRNFMSNLTSESVSVLDDAKHLIRSFLKHKLLSLSPIEIERLIMEYLNWNVKFGVTGIFFGSAEIIKKQTDLEIKKRWEGSEKQFNDFLNDIYIQTKIPLSNMEQRDLLDLSKLVDKEFEVAFKRHVNKYKHIIVRNFDDDSFSAEYYKERIELLQQNESEYCKAEKELRTVENEIKISNEILDESNLAEDLKEKVRFVKWLMYYRTEAADYHKIINGTYKPLFISIAKKFNLTINMVMQMTYTEIIDSLRKSKLSIPKDSIIDRVNNGYGYLLVPSPYEPFLVSGSEIDKLRNLFVVNTDNGKLSELKGRSAFKGKVSGVARVILDKRKASELKDDEILITPMTSPEFFTVIKKCKGIITNEGGIISHAAIMAREFRKPCITGTKIATDVIKTGQRITLDADNGVVIL